MRVEANTEDEFYAALGERGDELRQMDELIQAHAPDLERYFSAGEGSMGAGIGYGAVSYRTKAAKEPVQIPLLALTAQARHLALYACAVIDGQYLAEKYQPRLGKVNCGKSCIRFTRYDRIDEEGFAAMLADLNERYRRGDHLYGH